MSKKGFHDDDDEQLVEYVSRYSILYDHKHTDFRNVVAKDKVWKKIGEAMKKDGNQCKKRWKDIRDNYWKTVRKEQLQTGSAAPSSTTKWALFNRLDFLRDVERERSYFCSIPPKEPTSVEGLLSDEDGQNANETEPDTLQAIASLSSSDAAAANSSISARRSRKTHWDSINQRGQQRLGLLQRLANNREPEDNVGLFMRCIASSIRKLPRHLINKAKIDILSYVTRLDSSSESSHVPLPVIISPSGLSSLSSPFEQTSSLLKYGELSNSTGKGCDASSRQRVNTADRNFQDIVSRWLAESDDSDCDDNPEETEPLRKSGSDEAPDKRGIFQKDLALSLVLKHMQK
ncbi:uncharacterized protein LOC126431185 [Schistocerca serialis cubense]|uniref:uncharacterized protein LOC126431185 n=1 Tax=Schistocerca serialis cubense TaxID=2023355 RepID=UPI00214E75D0|nr:uncharacterized protein LOC126431185 [Schistocerca serialis cubense]